MSRRLFIFCAALSAILVGASGAAVADDVSARSQTFETAQGRQSGRGEGARGAGPQQGGGKGRQTAEEPEASQERQTAQAPQSGKGQGGRGRGSKNQGGRGQGNAESQGSDCSGAGRKAAAQTGGRVLSVSGSGGSCSVTVLVPGKDGGRPRKTTVTIRP